MYTINKKFHERKTKYYILKFEHFKSRLLIFKHISFPITHSKTIATMLDQQKKWQITDKYE